MQQIRYSNQSKSLCIFNYFLWASESIGWSPSPHLPAFFWGSAVKHHAEFKTVSWHIWHRKYVSVTSPAGKSGCVPAIEANSFETWSHVCLFLILFDWFWNLKPDWPNLLVSLSHIHWWFSSFEKTSHKFQQIPGCALPVWNLWRLQAEPESFWPRQRRTGNPVAPRNRHYTPEA